MAIIVGSDKNFEKDIQGKLTLVNFTATWCGPCKSMAPMLEELSEEIKVVKIDVDDHQEKATSLKVRGIPAFFIYQDGEKIGNFVGLNPKEKILEYIETAIREDKEAKELAILEAAKALEEENTVE